MEDDVQSQQSEVQEQDYNYANAFASEQPENDFVEEPEEQEVVSEVQEKPKGDLSIALRKERERARKLEADLAKARASLTNEGSIDPAAISRIVDQRLENEKSKQKAFEVLPELKTEEDIQVMVSALMFNSEGQQVRTAEQAAKVVAGRLGKLVEQKAESMVTERSAVQNAKEQATTAGSIAAPSNVDSEIADLKEQRSKSTSVKERSRLTQEIIKRKMM
jgi:hypothetical protein